MQPISIYQFNQLSNQEKYELIEKHGIYMQINRKERKFKIALFYLFDYYVEVWLNQETDKLHKASAFNSYKRLDPFLQHIDISSLLP